MRADAEPTDARRDDGSDRPARGVAMSCASRTSTQPALQRAAGLSAARQQLVRELEAQRSNPAASGGGQVRARARKVRARARGAAGGGVAPPRRRSRSRATASPSRWGSTTSSRATSAPPLGSTSGSCYGRRRCCATSPCSRTSVLRARFGPVRARRRRRRRRPFQRARAIPPPPPNAPSDGARAAAARADGKHAAAGWPPVRGRAAERRGSIDDYVYDCVDRFAWRACAQDHARDQARHLGRPHPSSRSSSATTTKLFLDEPHLKKLDYDSLWRKTAAAARARTATSCRSTRRRRRAIFEEQSRRPAEFIEFTTLDPGRRPTVRTRIGLRASLRRPRVASSAEGQRLLVAGASSSSSSSSSSSFSSPPALLAVGGAACGCATAAADGARSNDGSISRTSSRTRRVSRTQTIARGARFQLFGRLRRRRPTRRGFPRRARRRPEHDQPAPAPPPRPRAPRFETRRPTPAAIFNAIVGAHAPARVAQQRKHAVEVVAASSYLLLRKVAPHEVLDTRAAARSPIERLTRSPTRRYPSDRARSTRCSTPALSAGAIVGKRGRTPARRRALPSARARLDEVKGPHATTGRSARSARSSGASGCARSPACRSAALPLPREPRRASPRIVQLRRAPSPAFSRASPPASRSPRASPALSLSLSLSLNQSRPLVNSRLRPLFGRLPASR